MNRKKKSRKTRAPQKQKIKRIIKDARGPSRRGFGNVGVTEKRDIIRNWRGGKKRQPQFQAVGASIRRF